jgi:hypothetical protein
MKKKPQQVYDELIVLRSQAADKEAFDELVKRWQERLWRYAYRLTGSEQAAWDYESDDIYFYVHDHLYSPVALVQRNGLSVRERYEYVEDPWRGCLRKLHNPKPDIRNTRYERL